ncbi:hypothetical protein BC830DRAFT_94116 [Chytriomyces sp. MP71]|nr:hypothetical protein BC830DRAFT_94116 [Chytriomyces sp. MP71]
MSGKGKRSKKASAAPTEHESVENAGPVSATLDLEPVALDDSMNPWASPSPTSASAPTVPSETADEAVAKKASKKKKKALAATVEQFEQIPAGVPETILLPELLPKPVPEVEHHDIAPKPEVVPKKKAKKSKSSSALPTTAYGASVEIVSESAAVADVQSESISVVAVEVQDVQQVPAEEAKPGKKKSSKKLSKTIAMVEPTLEEQTSTPINLVAEQPTIVAVSVETPLVEDAASLSSSKKKSSKKVKNYNSDILAECRPGLEVAVEPVVDIAPEEVVGADEPGNAPLFRFRNRI